LHSSKDTLIYNSNENYSYKNLYLLTLSSRLVQTKGGISLSEEEKRKEEMKKLEEEKKKIKEKDWDSVDWDEDME
jgi:hypothetical protein